MKTGRCGTQQKRGRAEWGRGERWGSVQCVPRDALTVPGDPQGGVAPSIETHDLLPAG